MNASFHQANSNDGIPLSWFVATDTTEATGTTTKGTTTITTTTKETATSTSTTDAQIKEATTTTSTTEAQIKEATTTTSTTDAPETSTTGAQLEAAEAPFGAVETIEWANDELQEKAESDGSNDVDWTAFADSVGEEIESGNADIKSYFSCSSPSSTSGNVSPPGTAIVLKFDYDVTTIAGLDTMTLSELENRITENLAEIYGLKWCKRRYLRGLETDFDILALDSEPADVNVADTSECQQQNAEYSCTPISGSMTAYVGPGSNIEASMAKLLSLIKDSMSSGSYTNDNIIKTSYVGTRLDFYFDAPVTEVAGEDVDVTVNVATKEIQTEPLDLAIGISVFFVGCAILMAISFFFVNRRKKRVHVSDESILQPVEPPAKGVPEMKKVESSESTEKGTDVEEIESNSLSLSGDEEDLKYGITEDYDDLVVGGFAQQDIAYVHPESCLVAPFSDVPSFDTTLPSFETGTPIPTPTSSPRIAPVPDTNLLPDTLSPSTSEEENLLYPGMRSSTPSTETVSVEPGMLSPAFSTKENLFAASTGDDVIDQDIFSPLPSVEEYSVEPGMLPPACSAVADLSATSTGDDVVASDILSLDSKADGEC